MNLDTHHVLLYGAVTIVASVGAYAYHLRAIDVATAKAQVQAQQTVIDAAQKRMDDREKEFKDQITTLLAMKSTPATTPTQIVERIPQLYPQLQPTLQPAVNPQTGQVDTSKPPNLVFDAPQAKALNDQLVECKICQVSLTKAQADLVDTNTKLAGVTKERDDWKIAAKGGSIWKRTGRVLKWAAIGVAIGYAAAKH